MTLAVLVLLASIVIVLIGGLILGAAMISAKSDQAGGAFSARQDWMDSHINDRESDQDSNRVL